MVELLLAVASIALVLYSARVVLVALVDRAQAVQRACDALTVESLCPHAEHDAESRCPMAVAARAVRDR